MIKSKFTSQIVCIFIYVVSFYLSYLLLPESITDTWSKIVVWHIFATIFIYIGSLILNNSSLYDPFWSIAPVPIVVYLTLSFKNTIELIVLVSLPIFFWAIRLTRNWLITWQGFNHEDFRYIDLKNTNRVQAEINNFFGIHLVPTMLVNIGLYPLIYITTNEIETNIFLYLASIFTIVAVILETVSDEQMREFKSNDENKGKTMKYKLWKYSRHPNYLGEVLFWYGIYFMGLSSGIASYWTILCPTLMLALFIFVSCPMMDKRSLNNRVDYKEYMDKTSQLLLLPPKS
tara:strand:+ start:136 stop:999 length:864 start_codon:yes stop_codon:yes gene_type:complete